MKHLLDVSVLLSAIWAKHADHLRVIQWLEGKEIVLCPIAELGFLRISSNPRVFGASMDDAREMLERFVSERSSERIYDDLPALDQKATKTDEVTDQYLAALADKHGLRLATLDGGIKHAAVDLV